jgi:cytochrome c-type biogenesis protein CcmF
MVYDGFQGKQVAEDGRLMDIALVSVSRNGQKLADLRPRRDCFPGSNDPNEILAVCRDGSAQQTTIAGSYSTLENDFYVILVGWNEVDASSATFKVFINPLINLVWWGGIVLIIGTFVAAWPNEPSVVEMQRAPEPSRKHAGATA